MLEYCSSALAVFNKLAYEVKDQFPSLSNSSGSIENSSKAKSASPVSISIAFSTPLREKSRLSALHVLRNLAP